MICVDCGLSAIPKRSRCERCAKEHAKQLRLERQSGSAYFPEDHAGKRERLKAAIQAAIESGAIVPGGRG